MAKPVNDIKLSLGSTPVYQEKKQKIEKIKIKIIQHKKTINNNNNKKGKETKIKRNKKVLNNFQEKKKEEKEEKKSRKILRS
jgi:hypothetical protein